MDPFYLTIGGITLVGAVMLTPLFTCDRRASVELNLTPLWQKHCSGYIGSYGTLIMRVALYQEFLVIGFLGQTIIPYSDVTELKAKSSFLSGRGSGVSIKRRGMSSRYHFNLNQSDSAKFMNIIESHLHKHLAGMSASR